MKHPIENNLKHKISTLPHKPGIYQYFDEQGTIIYIGKAKDLKKRVSNYFTESAQNNRKTRALVSKIVDIKTVIVETELDALLLENNLIKKYQPYYNILLKDDKAFSWICIKKEPFPRIFSTRKVFKDGSLYFGPYPNNKVMYAILELLKELYPRRTCNLALNAKSIAEGKFNACLEFQIKNCKGPCIGEQSEDDYNEMISQVKDILKGNISSVITRIKKVQQDYVSKLQFEFAQENKERIELLENYRSKSLVVNASLTNLDVFTIKLDDTIGYVNYLRVVEGRILQTITLEYKIQLEETADTILTNAIAEIWNKYGKTHNEIIVEEPLETDFGSIKVTVPQIGDKRKLLDLSLANLLNYIRERKLQKSLVDPERHSKRILETMKKDLRLQDLPYHIECFDNSNFQGDYAVSSMVCFRNAKPSKKDYRHYSVKTVVGPNDFATMKEVVSRRYKRLLEEHAGLPQLIIIDGGKGQLGAAVEAISELGLYGKIAIISIAKKLEELYFPGDSVPLYLDKTSETLKVIQSLRNEAHRFAITYHRKKRSMEVFKTELTSIKGIGAKTSEDLLKHFGSVENIKQADKNAIENLIGKAKAEILTQYFKVE